MFELETNNNTANANANANAIIIENKINRLNTIKEQIEKMDINNHISALYMISQNKSIKYSENSNGIFLNLTELQDNMIKKLDLNMTVF